MRKKHLERILIKSLPRMYCIISDCPVLSPPTGGQVTVAGYSQGDTATYTCSQGYLMSGAATRMCQAGNTWSGAAPTCTARSKLLSKHGG